MTVRMMPVHPWFKDASFEDIICLAVLIASKALPYNATIDDSRAYYEKIEEAGGCSECPFHEVCLACTINE